MAPQTKKPRRGARAREPYDVDALTDIAVRVFGERGYDRTSMEDIAQAAGITKASIYYHVAGKEELLSRAVRRAIDALNEVLDEALALDTPAAERLRVLLEQTMAITVDLLPEVKLVLRVRGNTKTERWVLAQRRTFDEQVAELVRQGVAEGDLRADVEPMFVAKLLLGMSNSVHEWYRPKDEDGKRALIATLLGIAFDGVRA